MQGRTEALSAGIALATHRRNIVQRCRAAFLLAALVGAIVGCGASDVGSDGTEQDATRAGGSPPSPPPGTLTVTLSVSPTSITTGGSSTLTWSTTNATGCTASANPAVVGWSGSVGISGNQSSGALTATTDFTLTCSGASGSTGQTVTVTVVPPPPTVTLSANPTTITSGASSTLSWSATNATDCTASANPAVAGWSGSVGISGSQSSGALTATTNFTLTCSGAGGSAGQTVSVTVGPSGTPTVTLSASPTIIESDASSTLNWSTTNATGCTASANPAVAGWSGSKGISGSQSSGVLTATTDFTLTCSGASGSAGQTVTVTVLPPPPPPVANTYFVAPTGSNANTCAAAQSSLFAKQTIQGGLACLAPGSTLIIRDGTYSGSGNALTNIPNGSPGNYITIKAESEGNVIITAGLSMSHTDAYQVFQGLRFQSASEKTIVGNHLKFFRNEFKGGCSSGNCTNTTVGTNSFNDTADILFEDNWWHGSGGRYNLLIYNANRVVVRRGVIRHDGGWSDTKGDPEAGLNFYNSTNCSAQNVVILDSNLNYQEWQSAFYSVHNSASPNANTNNSWLGIISLNNLSGSTGAGLRFDGDASQSGHVVQNAVLWDANWGMNVAFTSSVGVTASRLTIGKTSGSGTAIGGDSGGTKSFTNVRLFGMSVSDVTVTNTVTGLPTYLPLQLAGIGADIVNRIGTTGTLQGELGWNTDTGQLLWPFPNEARIKKEMCTDAGVSRGFCSDALSLTNYIMDYLGNGNPF